MKQFAFGLMLLLIGVATCFGVTITTPMDNFWIAHGPVPPGALYGPSNASGSWLALQWGTNPPASDMLPFVAIPCSTIANPQPSPTNCFRAVGPITTVTQYTSGGNVIARIHSSGIMQPCYFSGTAGNPYEHDTFVQPINTTNYPGFPSGIVSSAALSTLTAFTFNAAINYKWAAQKVVGSAGGASGPACPPNGTSSVQQATLTLAITLSNATNNQTLFYQLAIGKIGFVNSNVQAGLFSVTNPYGYADDIINLNCNGLVKGCSSQIAALNTPVTYSLNVLPRLLFVLGLGNGIDSVAANWVVAGMYVGHVTYGPIGLITEWSNVSLVSTP